MSQNENPESVETNVVPTGITESQKSPERSEKICHISDDFKSWDNGDEIYNNLCRHTELFKHTDGKPYCLFHLPTEDKDREEFEKIISERIKAVETAFVEAEHLSDDEHYITENKLFYDFRYVIFPFVRNFLNHKFVTAAYFRSATFTSSADFRSATFLFDADFNSVTFNTYSYFNSATFNAYANFNSAIFTDYSYFRSAIFTSAAYFRSTTFKSDAYFKLATFMSDTNFNSATFTFAADFSSATFTSQIDFDLANLISEANFSQATFSENSQIYFRGTKFCSFVSFRKAKIDGSIEFEGNVFLNKKQVHSISCSLEIEKFVTEREAFLSFEQARINKSDQIYFNSIKLRPCWFINTEISNLNFTGVEWLNLGIDVNRNELKEEIKKLVEHKFQRPDESLRKAFNQLADNAETNRRSEEAKLFRKNALALNTNINCHINDAIDPEYKSEIIKNVCEQYPAVNEDGGNYFCLLHSPDKNKAELFVKEFKKLKNDGQTDFRGVNFPLSVRFSNTIREDLKFSYATFHKSVVFHEAIFRNADFDNTVFKEDSELLFEYSECRGSINLSKTVFEGTLFLNGFGERSFFTNKSLTKIRQEEYEKLNNGEKKEFDEKLRAEERLSDDAQDANKKALILTDARFKNPENINFRSVRLRPHYFAGVDSSKFVFHDCDWKDANENELKIQDEISNSSNKQLTQICNELAINYEEDRNFEESSYFRYTAMQSKRLEKSLNGWLWTLDWLYWLSSGYGERRFRAFGVLILLISLCGFIYATHFSVFEANFQSGETLCEKYRIKGNAKGMGVCDGIVHSLAVASFQRPDPKPADSLTKFVVTLEMILVPLQAALLALAIRRKFMR